MDVLLEIGPYQSNYTASHTKDHNSILIALRMSDHMTPIEYCSQVTLNNLKGLSYRE